MRPEPACPERSHLWRSEPSSRFVEQPLRRAESGKAGPETAAKHLGYSPTDVLLRRRPGPPAFMQKRHCPRARMSAMDRKQASAVSVKLCCYPGPREQLQEATNDTPRLFGRRGVAAAGIRQREYSNLVALYSGQAGCPDEPDCDLTLIVKSAPLAAEWARILSHPFEPCRTDPRQQVPGLRGGLVGHTEDFSASWRYVSSAVRGHVFDNQHAIGAPVVGEEAAAIRAALTPDVESLASEAGFGRKLLSANQAPRRLARRSAARDAVKRSPQEREGGSEHVRRMSVPADVRNGWLARLRAHARRTSCRT